MTEESFQRWKRNGNFTLTHERILTVSNHVAEGEGDCYTKKEAAEVAMYHSLDCYNDCPICRPNGTQKIPLTVEELYQTSAWKSAIEKAEDHFSHYDGTYA